jgi:hypothetical protein
MQAEAKAKAKSSGPRDGAFALLAACCRPPADVARDQAVRLAAGAVDWARFERLAARHRVEGLAVEALARAGVSPPPPVIDSLRATAARSARLGLAQAAESVRIQAALDGAGLPSLVLKGVVLDILAWGRIGLKSAWDIDLLVLPKDVPAAVRVLAELGYGLVQPAHLADDPQAWRRWMGFSKECVFAHRVSGLAVELHWRAADSAGLLPSITAASPARRVALTPTLGVRTLGEAETFAYLCVHGSSHGWARLKWLADLAALVAPLSPAQVAGLCRQAESLRAGRCPAVALLLAAQLFGSPVPREIESQARRLRTRALAALALEALRGGDGRELAARPLLADVVLASQLLFADGARWFLAELARLWVSADDRLRLRLPRSLHGLYHLARIPSWMLRRAHRRASALPAQVGTAWATRKRARF